MSTAEYAAGPVTETIDIAIIGAGPVGGALACQLAALGKKVLLIDQAALPPMEHPDFDGRAYAIAAGSKRLLDQAGLWDSLPYPPCPILDIKVTDGKPGYPASPLHLQFDHRAVGIRALRLDYRGPGAPDRPQPANSYRNEHHATGARRRPK